MSETYVWDTQKVNPIPSQYPLVAHNMGDQKVWKLGRWFGEWGSTHIEKACKQRLWRKAHKQRCALKCFILNSPPKCSVGSVSKERRQFQPVISERQTDVPGWSTFGIFCSWAALDSVLKVSLINSDLRPVCALRRNERSCVFFVEFKWAYLNIRAWGRERLLKSRTNNGFGEIHWDTGLKIRRLQGKRRFLVTP